MLLTGRTHRAALLFAGFGLLAACSAPSTPGSTTSGQGATTLVLGNPYGTGKYNVLDGHGQYGASPIFEGLLAMTSDGDAKPPRLTPRLAQAPPAISDDGLTWTVKVKPHVTFSDGTPLDAGDVVATYRNLIDPKVASPIAASLAMLKSIDTVDEQTVRFTLAFPYAEFDSRLLLGIAPSEKLTGVAVDASPLNASPIGTGPYVLSSASADNAVLKVNPNYHGPKPSVETVTMVHIEDDNARAQRMAAGELDGTVLPPALARTLKDKKDMVYTSVRSVDFRTISLPKTSAFTADPAARLAMNLAVDRQAMVDKVLAGEGSPIATPITPELGAAHSPDAHFRHDPAAAEATLESAGWVKGTDGFRAKGGEKATFTLLYAAADTLRGQLATAFAADMKKIGVRVALEGSTWEKIEPQLGKAGLVLGGGSYPTSPDALLYEVLHRRTPATSSLYSNPGNFGSDTLDRLLESARRERDTTRRNDLYRQVQRQYVADPGSVFLVALRHTYVAKASAPATKQTVLEPHAHDVGWGPWWDLGRG